MASPSSRSLAAIVFRTKSESLTKLAMGLVVAMDCSVQQRISRCRSRKEVGRRGPPFPRPKEMSSGFCTKVGGRESTSNSSRLLSG